MKSFFATCLSLTALLGAAGADMASSGALLSEFEGAAGQKWADVTVRANGNFIATRINAPEVWTINPNTGQGRVLVHVPGVLGISGIVEVRPDVFIFAGANFTEGTLDPATVTPGSGRLFQVDLNTDEDPPRVSAIVILPSGAVPNGLTRRGASQVLVADIAQGQIYRVELQNATAPATA